VGTGQTRATLKGHTQKVLAVAFSPDGKTLVSAGSGDASFPPRPGELLLWDVEKAELRATLKGHLARVTAVACSADGHTLASCAEDGTVRFWELTTGQERGTFKRAVFGPLAFSPDGRFLATGLSHKEVELWDVKSGR
jgi:WD40 repeat protein